MATPAAGASGNTSRARTYYRSRLDPPAEEFIQSTNSLASSFRDLARSFGELMSLIRQAEIEHHRWMRSEYRRVLGRRAPGSMKTKRLRKKSRKALEVAGFDVGEEAMFRSQDRQA